MSFAARLTEPAGSDRTNADLTRGEGGKWVADDDAPRAKPQGADLHSAALRRLP